MIYFFQDPKNEFQKIGYMYMKLRFWWNSVWKIYEI